MVDVTAFDETDPDCADAVNCDELLVPVVFDVSAEELLSSVLVAVVVGEVEAVAVARFVVATCVFAAMQPASTNVVPTLTHPATRRLRRAGCGRLRRGVVPFIGRAWNVCLKSP